MMTAKDQISSISDLFEKFGGPAEVGRAIGVTTEHASLMKQRKSIPVARWPVLIASPRGQELGLTSDELLRLHAAPFRGAGEIEAAETPAIVKSDKGQDAVRATR